MSIRKVALMASDFEDGGVERNFANLALGFARLGVETCFLAGNPGHAYLRDLGDAVRVLPFDGSRSEAARELIARERPDVLLTGKLADDYAAVAARDSLGADPSGRPLLVTAVGTLLSGRFAGRRWNLLRVWRERRRIAACYARLDGICAVSQQVAGDLARGFGVRRTPVQVLCNPVVPEDHRGLAAAPCPHPWLAALESQAPLTERPPLVLAVGGLRQVKDFATLLQAFARLDRPDARLLILGEGKERPALERLVRRLGLGSRVDLPGFVPSPYPYLARARLLALSSRREGLPNAVVEALATGLPAVATDCSEGLRALLGEAGLGAPVPVGDAAALSRAIAGGLAGTPDRARLEGAARPYGLLAAARAHLDFFASLPAPGKDPAGTPTLSPEQRP